MLKSVAMLVRCRPTVPFNVANSILARTLALMEDIATYHIAREVGSRKRKWARHAAAKEVRAVKRRKTDGNGPETGTNSAPTVKLPQMADATTPNAPATHGSDASRKTSAFTTGQNSKSQAANVPVPPVLSHLTIGINEVTKRLEAQSKALLQRVVVTSTRIDVPPAPSLSSRPVSVVLVCQGDVDPPILIAHLPQLVAACNSAIRPSKKDDPAPCFIKLIPLPKGAERVLAEGVGLRRASVLALDVSSPRHSAATLSLNPPYRTRLRVFLDCTSFWLPCQL
jgi:ribonuclease P/MRP protein subunit POP3